MLWLELQGQGSVIERKDTRFKDSRPSVFSVLYLTDILYLRKLLEGFMNIGYDLSLQNCFSTLSTVLWKGQYQKADGQSRGSKIISKRWRWFDPGFIQTCGKASRFKVVFRDRNGSSQGEMSDSNGNNSWNGVMVQLVNHLPVKCQALMEIIRTHIKSQIGYQAVCNPSYGEIGDRNELAPAA